MGSMKDLLGDKPFDLFSSRAARDAAFTKVTKKAGSAWVEKATTAIRRLPPGWSGTGEDVRICIARAGVEPPHHPNAWGALINSARRRGFLKATGRYTQMKAVRSHARKTEIYERGENR